MDWSHRLVTRTIGLMRAARFAEAVAARHTGDPGAWLRCAMGAVGAPRVLLRRRRVGTVGAPATITIAPRIELRLATTGARVEGGERAEGARAASVCREPARTVSASTAVPMLQRAAVRGVRHDGPESGVATRERPAIATRHAGVGAMPATTESTPSARVLRRRAPTIAAAPAPVRDEPSVRAVTQPSRAVPLSPVEVNRLTDHIVQTIDRRIAAFRERQGRV